MVTALRQRLDRRGLALPAFRTRGGYFASKTPHATAWGNLMLTIFTPLGGRFMNRGFGSGINDVLFEPNLPDLASTAEYVIRDTAATWTPNIVITRILTGRNGKKMQFKVSFHLDSDSQVEDRLIELSITDVVRLIAVQGN